MLDRLQYAIAYPNLHQFTQKPSIFSAPTYKRKTSKGRVIIIRKNNRILVDNKSDAQFNAYQRRSKKGKLHLVKKREKIKNNIILAGLTLAPIAFGIALNKTLKVQLNRDREIQLAQKRAKEYKDYARRLNKIKSGLTNILDEKSKQLKSIKNYNKFKIIPYVN